MHVAHPLFSARRPPTPALLQPSWAAADLLFSSGQQTIAEATAEMLRDAKLLKEGQKAMPMFVNLHAAEMTRCIVGGASLLVLAG